MKAWERSSTAAKVAEATSVPFPDSSVDTASSAPIPGLAVGNKPAPGQTGPKGMAPRTNYSRVNNGSPINSDAGTSAQKGAAPDQQSFLPQKIAHSEVSMPAATPRFTIHEMVKAAASGAADHSAVTLEAARQLASQGDAPAVQEKTASAGDSESIPTDYVDKLASAVEFVLTQLDDDEAPAEAAKTATIGEGPNTLKTMEGPGGKNTIAPGQQGSATPSHQVPKSTSTVNPGNQPAGPATALETNKPVAGKQKVSAAAPQFTAPIADLRKVASAPVAPEVAAAPAVDSRLVDYMLGAVKQAGASVVKVAEDAINPAKISAGSADSTMLQRSAAGEDGGAPAGGKPQGPTGLVASNDAARNYTRADAKAQVKPQLAKVLSEPALSAAHDNVLQKSFAHTGQAGVKIAASVKTAAARAILEKMAEEAAKGDKTKDKKKESAGGMSSFNAPPVGGVAGSGT